MEHSGYILEGVLPIFRYECEFSTAEENGCEKSPRKIHFYKIKYPILQLRREAFLYKLILILVN